MSLNFLQKRVNNDPKLISLVTRHGLANLMLTKQQQQHYRDVMYGEFPPESGTVNKVYY